MFDSYSVKTQHPEKIEHKYNLAPTGQNIKLLKELEDQAKASVSKILIAENNSINFTVAIGKEMFGPHLYLKAKINQKEYTTHFPINSMVRDEIWNKIYDQITQWVMASVDLSGLVHLTIDQYSHRITNKLFPYNASNSSPDNE